MGAILCHHLQSRIIPLMFYLLPIVNISMRSVFRRSHRRSSKLIRAALGILLLWVLCDDLC